MYSPLNKTERFVSIKFTKTAQRRLSCNPLQRLLKISLFSLLVFVLLSIGISLAIRTATVQNFVLQKALAFVSSKTDADVRIGSFDWNMLQDLSLNNFYLGDKKGDTLIYAKTLNIDFDSWSLTKKQLKIDAIRIENAKVNLILAKDGSLNLASLFNKKGEKNEQDTTSSQPFDWATELDEIELENIDFSFQDNKKKQTIYVSVPELELKLKELDLAKKHISISSLSLEKPYVAYTKLDTAQKSQDTARFHFLPKDWLIRWDKVSLNEGRFSYNAKHKPTKESGMDFSHIDISEINFLTHHGSLNRDSVKTTIAKLSATEKSGLQIISSKGVALVSLNEVRYSDFQLATNNSTIGNQFSLTYNRFEDFFEFLSKVSITADLKNSNVSFNDLSYLVKGLEPFAHNSVAISGKIKGKISSFEMKDVLLKSGTGTILSGNLYASGLPKIQETFLNLRLKSLNTNVNDIRLFAPTLSDKIPVNVNTLGNIRFSGNLDGFVSDFVAHGILTTDIGNAQSDLNFKYNPKTTASKYSGHLKLEQFNLGKWFNDTTIGTVSATAELNGKGVKLSTLDSKVDGTIDSFTFKQYAYKNIKLNGHLRSKSFEGDIISTDPNIEVTFHGKANLADSVPVFNFSALISNIALKDLHLSPTDYRFQGIVNANFSGKTIDKLNGLLEANNLVIWREDERQNIRNITLQAQKKNDGTNELLFSTDRADGVVSGNYSLTALPKVLKNYFYRTVYLIEDTTQLPAQDFTFNFEISDSFPLLRMINPNLKFIGSSYLRGSLNSTEKSLHLKGFIPEFTFGNYTAEHINILGDLNDQHTTAIANINRLYAGDSLLLDTIAFNLHNVTDGYVVNTQIHDRKHFNRINSDIFIKPQTSQAELSVVNMDAWLSGKKWTVSEKNNIRISKGRIDISNLIFNSDNQRIAVASYRKNDDKEACISIKLFDTSLGDLISVFSPRVKNISASLSGNIDIENLLGKPLVLADVNVKDIRIDKENLGSFAVKSVLNNELNRIELNGLMSGENKAAISGFYNLQKNNQRLELQANLDNASLSFLNLPFFERYVRNVRGSFSGNLAIAGPLNALTLEGKIRINEAEVVVSYLNTRYAISNEDIVLSKDGYFDIGDLRIRDIKNNIATGTGRIYHSHFKNFRLALSVNAQNVMFLNTTAKDNSVFYGQIYGTGRVAFSGTIPEVDITAKAQMTQGTHCYIPINSSYETSKYSFYNFIDKNADSLKTIKREQIKLKGVNLRLTVEVTPESTVDILLDPVAGDVLSVNGSSPSLNIEVLRTGEFNIRGLYEITKGNYLFTLQDIVNKRFQLNPGGTINFTGNVYKAQLNADAVYNVRTSMYDLIYDPAQVESGLSAEAEARAKNRVITKLLLKLTGVLEKPNVAFDIAPQDVDPLIRSFVESKLNIIRSTESELNKQAFGLLVMNRFLPSGSSVANGNYVGGSAINTVGEFLSSQISRYMGNLFESVGVQGLDINLNFQQYDQQGVSQYDKRNEVQLALTKRFFNNRLSVSAGGNFDFGDRTTDIGGTPSSSWTTNVNGDFQVEYSLTKSGNLRARAFNRGSYDNLRPNTNINKTGVGISYRQDFDTLRELFRRKKKKQQQKTSPAETPANNKESGTTNNN